MSYRIVSTLQQVRGYYHVRGRVYSMETGAFLCQFGRSTRLSVKGHNKRRAKGMVPIIEESVLKSLENEKRQREKEPTLAEYISYWLEKKKCSKKENTVVAYQQYADAHIVPAIGSLKIRGITVQALQAYYNKKLKTLSVNSLKKQHCVVKGALDAAVRDGIIQSNPANFVEFPTAKKFSGQAYTVEQLSTLLNGANEVGEPLKAALVLASCYGLRREECLGLRWEDVDFRKNEMHVHNTVVRAGKEIIESAQGKTAKSDRYITLVPATVPYLRALKQHQAEIHQNLDKVVRWDSGKEVEPSYLTRAATNLMKRSGLPHIRFHDLRHTAASLLAETATPKQVQEFLGHEDVSTTLNIYTHIHRQGRDETANLMNKKLNSADFCSAFCSATGLVARGTAHGVPQKVPKTYKKDPKPSGFEP